MEIIMSREITDYDIIDTFDQNKFQTVLMGIDKSNYQDIVIINKLYKSDSINQLFIDKYKKFSENIVGVTSSENEFIVINQYEEAALISDFLNDNSLDLNERIRLGKSFLYQISDYENIEPALQHVFIQADQLTIKNGVLKFSNYILLKDYNSKTTHLDILREIGKTLEVILQLHKEKLTSDSSSLQQFIYKLLKSNEIPDSYNDLYNNFKVIAAKLQEDEIMYTPLFDEDELIQSKDDANQLRIPKIIQTSIAPVSNAEIEDIKITYESIEDRSTDDLLDVINNIEEDEIYLIEDDIELFEETSDKIIENIKYDYHELGDEGDLIIESLDESDELIEDVIPSEETIDHAIDQLLKFTEPDKSMGNIKSNNLTKNMDIFKPILPKLHDVDDSDDVAEQAFEISPENGMLDEPNNKNNDTGFQIPNNEVNVVEDIFRGEVTNVSEFNEGIVNEVFELELDHTEDTSNNDHKFKSDFLDNMDDKVGIETSLQINVKAIRKESKTTTEYNSIITEDVVDEILELDNQNKYHDEKHHSIVLSNDNSNPIQEILDRNDKQYSDLYVSEKKKAKRFLPTFLLFFIVLIVITSLLIYYTSSYM